MSQKCYKCFRPLTTCFCPHIHPVDTGVKFVILMHPREAYKQKTGTGRLTSLSLIDSEIIIATQFDDNKRYKELLASDDYYPMVLYPGAEAMNAAECDFSLKGKGRKLLVFLVDATWIMARKMVYKTPSLQTLPRLSFTAAYTSQFHIKRQPAEYCLSTIESTYYLIKELQDAGLSKPGVSVQGLMDVFALMNKIQLDHKKNRSI
ncbi:MULTISPECIES: tRNA-uridine aminocarboxypropyltransferase [unclassified Oceanispirochaeta]|uniref:tRNA-uridine aminocarboxypropyltransferase n=1 Tax=unclassified Oceanispirochaeta TaxID=2635722 RepID=UPI000E08F8BC|nr:MULTISPECIES: tRNA-uridine aminocarboxypropyltransferase [unclassified Oceanispirochaeta]MBF9014546.1 DTW domain-containing protein [Oceanispirochaeta sp. M2]NPD70802.1 DTW domain-containing protein [Oceanispirochaeta sp. M1]RDG34085.1 DTW domain-containing protein [Oceanispirochaeta sp. M1]